MKGVGGLGLGDAEWRGLGYLGLTIALVAFAAWFLYVRMGPIRPRLDPMPYLQHLEELRLRILRSGILIILWGGLFFSTRYTSFQIGSVPLGHPMPSLYNTAAAQAYQWVAATTVPPGVKLLVSSPLEAVGGHMEVALVLALFVSLPFVVYEAWAFFSPGLGSREQRFLRRAAPAAFLLFLAGAAFGFFLVVPTLFAILYGFAVPLGAETYVSVGSLVGTVTTLILLFGAAFELPLAMSALVRLGFVQPQAYLRKWRHATIVIFLVAALASDPTLASQLIIGCMLFALYWAGVLLGFLSTPGQPIVRPNRIGKAS